MASNSIYTSISHALYNPRPFDIFISISVLCLFIFFRRSDRRASTALSGPPSENLLFGVSKTLFQADDPAILYEEWAEKYGPAYRMPLALGSSRIVLCDPKAVTYFYTREPVSFRMKMISKIAVEQLFGRGLIWAEGESHTRQRKALTPGFTNQAIRALTSVFFDSAYKLEAGWDTILDESPNGEASIDVQVWMNKVSLDTIGIAGFSHDFGTLHGKHSTVAETFESFTRLNPTGPSFASLLVPLLTPALPLLAKLPTGRKRTVQKLNNTMGQIADDLLTRMRDDKKANRIGKGGGPESLIETLILAEDSQSQHALSESEVLSQMKTLILAGYETTSICLTWALINLSLHPDVQDTLRAELSQLDTDPTFEQLNTSLPYLDAVTKETFRLHPPVSETVRVAIQDEVIPLGMPLKTLQGEVVDKLLVKAGTTLSSPIRLLNRSKAIWGEDAKEYKPSRWLSGETGIPDRAKEIHGYSHLMTFIDGARMCLGKQFAVTEFKAVLATLIRHYKFRLRDGPETKFEKVLGVLPRPRIAGEKGSRVPVLVKRVG